MVAVACKGQTEYAIGTISWIENHLSLANELEAPTHVTVCSVELLGSLGDVIYNRLLMKGGGQMAMMCGSKSLLSAKKP